MTVKPETTFWKNVKKSLEGGEYIVSRLESYVTPGFPDCVIFHNVTGFFTIELKIIQPNNKVKFSVFQKSFLVLRSYFVLSFTIFCLYWGDVLKSFATGFLFDRKDSFISLFFKFSI